MLYVIYCDSCWLERKKRKKGSVLGGQLFSWARGGPTKKLAPGLLFCRHLEPHEKVFSSAADGGRRKTLFFVGLGHGPRKSYFSMGADEKKSHERWLFSSAGPRKTNFFVGLCCFSWAFGP